MQKIILTLLLVLSFHFGLSQSNNNYIMNYKSVLQKENFPLLEKLISVKTTFFSNQNICFLADFQITAAKGVHLNKVDSTKTYLNYKNDKLYYDLEGKTAYNLKKIEFKKTESDTTKIMGFDILKYKSVDGNIEVFITKELPWYIQPCVFIDNRLDGAILKLINHKTNYVMVLTDYEQVADVPEEYKDIIKKIKNHPATKTKTIVSPLLATGEEEK